MLNPYSLSDKSCSVLCRDREGGIWVGTLLGGVNYCANLNFVFDKYIPMTGNTRCSAKRSGR